LAEAEALPVLGRLEGKEYADVQAARSIALNRMQQAMVRFAELPAMSRNQLSLKKHAIGAGRIKRDIFRDAIARDEAYLRVKAANRKGRAS
jgi:hypothetical protein